MTVECCPKHEMLDGRPDPDCPECQRLNGVRKE